MRLIIVSIHNNTVSIYPRYAVVTVTDIVGRGYHCTSDGRILSWSIHFISEHLSRSKAICTEKLSINDRFYKAHARFQVTLVATYNIYVVRTVSLYSLMPEDEKQDDCVS